MTRVSVRVDEEVSEELLSAFPRLSPTVQRVQTVLTGDVVDQSELQGLLNHLDAMGLTILEVLTIPD